jgi:hypothetical protein
LYAISLHAVTEKKRTASIPAPAAVQRAKVVTRRRVAS